MIAAKPYATPQDALCAIVDVLDGVQQRGEQYEARCPAHEDQKPSLGLRIGDKGGVVLHCLAGCTEGAIISALSSRLPLGLCNTDLYPPLKKGPSREIDVVYDFRNADGKVAYQEVRYKNPKDFRLRKPKPGGGHDWSIKGVRRVPYRLPELLAADPGELVFMCEGPKDVETAVKLGLVATTNAQGAKGWRPSLNKHFEGRQVVALPHNDEAGQAHAKTIERELGPVAASVKVVRLPGPGGSDPPPKWDLTDWVEAGGTVEELRSMAAAADPSKVEPNDAVKNAEGGLEKSDSGNARQFVRHHADEAMFCHPWRSWLIWDGTRWKQDDAGKSLLLGKETVRQMAIEAANRITLTQDEDPLAWPRKSADLKRIEAMLKLAAPELPVVPAELDRDTLLLNCPNGTVDLGTGRLRPHDRGDRITKLCPTPFDPDATAPRWEAFVEEIFGGECDLIAWSQRFLGYCLTGDVSEKVLAVFNGPGDNGKTALLEAVESTVGGDYVTTAAGELLIEQQGRSHPTSMADLCGVRMAFASESGESGRLNEEVVKRLTGRDTVKARRMRQDYFEFRPTHKLILCTNHRPEISGHDRAIWSRIRSVPFDVTFHDPGEGMPVKDPGLPAVLRDEAPGILAWLVRGAVEWGRTGLGTCDAIERSSMKYRDEQDIAGRFLREKTIVAANANVRLKELEAALSAWCDEIGAVRPSVRKFRGRLSDRFEPYTNNGTCYRGLALRQPTEATEVRK